MSASNERMLREAGYILVGDRAVKRADAAVASLRPPEPSPVPYLSAAARSRLQPEQRLQVDVVEMLRPEIEAAGGKITGTNGELPGGRGGEHKAYVLAQCIRSAMGYQRGFCDLAVWWPRDRGGPCGLIELKIPTSEPDLLGHRKPAGGLFAEQRAWRDFCRSIDLPWALCRSVRAVRETCVQWGALP